MSAPLRTPSVPEPLYGLRALCGHDDVDRSHGDADHPVAWCRVCDSPVGLVMCVSLDGGATWDDSDAAFDAAGKADESWTDYHTERRARGLPTVSVTSRARLTDDD